MSIVFYTAPMSTATVTELVIEELGLQVDRKVLDLKAGDAKQPAYTKVNPNQKVPCIVHDGVAIWESAAICMYLGEMFGVAKGVYPAPGPKRGEAMKWIVWANVSLGEAVYRRGHNQEWAPAGEANPKAAARAEADVYALLGILDGALAGKQFLVGEFTLADAHLHSFCDWLRHSKYDFSKYANLEAWSARCAERPAYKAVMAREFGGAK